MSENSPAVSFEDFGHDNGTRHWFAVDLMTLLDYGSWSAFRRVINKAMTACAPLGVKITDEFIETTRHIDGQLTDDYKLTRFACYLIAMNADPRKTRVAEAQAYFAQLAETFRNYVESAEAVERVIIRDKMSEGEKSLSGVAHAAGVQNYPYFQNARYRGMYNMNINELRRVKGVESKRSPLDFMGKRELAANLFCITETEAEIIHKRIRGQKPLEATAESVGKRVRSTMIQSDGVSPEELPPADDIRDVKKEIKQHRRDFKKIDSPSRKRKKNSGDES